MIVKDYLENRDLSLTSVGVPNGGLLVEGIDLQHVGIGGGRLQVLDLLGSIGELLRRKYFH